MQALPAKFRVRLESLPLVSLAIATAWLLVWLGVEIGYGSLLRESRDAYFHAARLSANDPTIEVSSDQMKVVRAVTPGFENDSLLEFMRKKADAEAVKLAQASFDEIAATAAASLHRHPFHRFGLIPANRSARNFATHFVIHSGFLHLLASLLVLLLAAPLLEQRWGSWILALHSSMIVIGSAGVYVLCHPESERALVGGSALIAGLVAAVVVRNPHDQVKFLAWLTPVASLNLVAPAWMLAGIWLVYEASLWVIAQGALPPGADNAVGYSAHAGAVLLGASLGLLFGKLGFEKTPVTNDGGKATQRGTIGRFDLDQVLELERKGDLDTAYAMLEQEVQRSARNRNVVLAYWKMAIERESATKAAPVLVRLIEEDLRRGATKVAARHWKMLHETAPAVLLNAASLIRLAPSIETEHGEEAVAAALRQALDKKNQGLTSTLAANIARMAVEVDTRLAALAARRALASDDLDEKTRAEMQMLGTALAPSKGGNPTRKKKAPAASAFFEESDRSKFGEVGDLSKLADDCFPDGVIREAVLVGLSTEEILIQGDGEKQTPLAFGRVRALAIVGVHGLGPKPVVLMDFLIDGGATPEPLTLLRLRCDRFDPRRFVPAAPSAKEALCVIVRGLRKRGLHVLADVTAPSTDSAPIFESVDAYHDKVLRPVASDFA